MTLYLRCTNKLTKCINKTNTRNLAIGFKTGANGLVRTDIVMWPYETRRQTRTYINNLLRRLVLRTLLLVAVCLMSLKINPRIQDIPHQKLLCDYKRPRHPSIFPIWAMVFLVVLEPLAIFWMITTNFKDIIEVVLMWSMAITISVAVTEILKLAVGRPRPDFYYRCFPDGIMTNSELLCTGKLRDIMTNSDLLCTGKLRDIMEGRKSFPSGHTSLSFASLGMLSLFMYRRCIVLYEGQSRASQLLCYSMPLMVATAIGVSRWLDNHHHWEDVLVGAIIGLSTSYFCFPSEYKACEYRELLEFDCPHALR